MRTYATILYQHPFILRFGSYPRLRRLALSRLARVIAAERPEVLAPLGRYFAGELRSPEGRIPYEAVSRVLQVKGDLEPDPNIVADTELLSYDDQQPIKWSPHPQDARRYDLATSEVEQLLASFHRHQDGDEVLIDRHEWMAAMLDWRSMEAAPEWAGWTEAVFDGLDKEHSGVITRQVNLTATCCYT